MQTKDRYQGRGEDHNLTDWPVCPLRISGRGSRVSEKKIRQYDCIIVDEAQFATAEQIDFLADVVDFWNITVICYGLRADFQNHLFPGSARLLAIADKIQEIKTACWCGRKATCNARYNEAGIVRSGEQVMLGGNDSYIALCRKHFKMGMLYDPEKKQTEKE